MAYIELRRDNLGRGSARQQRISTQMWAAALSTAGRLIDEPNVETVRSEQHCRVLISETWDSDRHEWRRRRVVWDRDSDKYVSEAEA